MTVYIGSNEILDAKLGADQVEKLYLGETEVWSAEPPAPIKALKFSCESSNGIYFFADRLGTLTPSFEYSLDDGATWTEWATYGSTVNFGNGTDLYLRGMNDILSSDGAYHCVRFAFSNNNLVDCTGNIMHLFDYTQDLTAFPNVSGTNGVGGMFNDCIALRSAPELPATTLCANCYTDLFRGCSNLIRPPKLPALTLVNDCYHWMFRNCTNLEALPQLPATTTAGSCYKQMFYGCSKIKLSETQTGEYVNEFTLGKVPTGSQATEMFTNTGGTFTGVPTQLTYYTSNEVIS